MSQLDLPFTPAVAVGTHLLVPAPERGGSRELVVEAVDPDGTAHLRPVGRTKKVHLLRVPLAELARCEVVHRHHRRRRDETGSCDNCGHPLRSAHHCPRCGHRTGWELRQQGLPELC